MSEEEKKKLQDIEFKIINCPNKLKALIERVEIIYLFKMIEKLENENKTLKFQNQELKGSLMRKIGFEHQSIFNEIKENSIPKLVIKNKIQQVKNKIKIRCNLIERMSGCSLEEMIEDVKISCEYKVLTDLLKEGEIEK